MCDAVAVVFFLLCPLQGIRDQAELMLLLCVGAVINSFYNSEHLPVCWLSVV